MLLLKKNPLSILTNLVFNVIFLTTNLWLWSFHFFSSGYAFKSDIFNIDDILEILFVVCAVVCKVPSRQANLAVAILLFMVSTFKLLDVLQLCLIFGLTSNQIGNLRDKNLKVNYHYQRKLPNEAMRLCSKYDFNRICSFDLRFKTG